MNEEINKKDYKTLYPFKGWVLENFPFIEADFDAINNYQLMCKVTEYLNNVIYNQNQVQDLSNELVDGYNDLLEYVNNYFENLDVQDEINNKLDEMVEDGTFNNLLSAYVTPILNEQNNRIDEQDTIISQQNSILSNLTTRMDSFTELTEGSTTGDAELVDGRISRTGLPYPNIGENIRQSTQNNFDEYANYGNRTRTANLFNKNDCLKGYAVNNSNGTLTASASYTTTNFIKIEGATVHRCATGNMAWYDADKQFVSGVSYSGLAIQTKPEGAVYMRTSIANTTFNSNPDAWWIGDNQDVPRFTPYYKYDILNDKLHNQTFKTLEESIENQSDYSFKDSEGYITRIRTANKLDKNACLKGYYVGNYGELVTSATYYVTPFIQITGDTVYRSHAGNMAWYDENKKFLSYVNYQGTASQSKPSGAVYMRTSILNTALDSASIGDGVSVPTNTPYYTYLLKNNLNKNTARIFKKVVCIGDSYTSGYIVDGNGVSHDTYDYSWPTYMENITGNKYVNCSLGGRNVLTWQTSNNCYTKALASGKAQAYIIGLGLNDSGNGTAHVDVGTVDDIGTNAQTYYGGMSQIIDKMLTISPTAKIFIQTIPSTDSQYTPYNTAIRNIVSYYNTTLSNSNVMLLDLYDYRSLYSTNSITGDSWHGHYTAMGYEQFAENLNFILSDYINTHISSFRDVAFIPYDE